jgi:23S rRNA (guanosine2251-2'-O)-methyltransferase
MRKLKTNELGRKSVDEFKKAEKIPLIIVLDNIRSALNVGSIFRTADSFLVEAIYLCGITACPPHREIQKTALGATETMAWQYFESNAEAIRSLNQKKYRIISVEQTSKSILLNDFHIERNEKIAVIFGNEITGVNEEFIAASDIAIEIPQAGTKHSLNISVCVGIVVWEMHNKLQKAY